MTVSMVHVRLFLSTLLLGVVASGSVTCFAADQSTQNNVLIVSSYHKGFSWSEGVNRGAYSRFRVSTIKTNTFYMNAWLDQSAESISRSLNRLESLIQQVEPKLIIISDDIAAKHVVSRLSRITSIPMVLTGIRLDASNYKFPSDNVTGIADTAYVASLIGLLSDYSEGNKIGFLGMNTLSARENLKGYTSKLNRPFNTVYLVDDLEEWKERFIELQSSVDMMILEDPEGLGGWKIDQFKAFVQREAIIPIGSTYIQLAPLSLVTIGRVPEEQGWWAADTALKILSGAEPGSIPVAQSKEGKLLVNLLIAEKLGLLFTPELLEIAEVIR